MVFDEGWDKVEAAGFDIPASIRGVRGGFNAAIPRLLADLAAAPTTMIHGDFRADNLVFGEDGAVAAFDFQLIGTGSGSYDLAYFVTQSLEVDVADANEAALFDRYTAGLTAGGVPEGDLDGLWERYRKAALFCLVYPIVASRGMDLDDPRQRGLVACMLRRFDRAVRQLDLAELI
jgi:thiamine kinase-like enzyme